MTNINKYIQNLFSSLYRRTSGHCFKEESHQIWVRLELINLGIAHTSLYFNSTQEWSERLLCSFKSFIICNECYAVPGLQIPDYYPLQKTQLHFSTSQHYEDQPTPGTPGKYQQLRSHTELPAIAIAFSYRWTVLSQNIRKHLIRGVN